jgi:hypothetical protein
MKEMRIRILPLVKVMPIRDHWSTDPQGPHFEVRLLHFAYERPRFHFESSKLLNFEFNADPDQAFKNNADPSGSASLKKTMPTNRKACAVGTRYLVSY